MWPVINLTDKTSVKNSSSLSNTGPNLTKARIFLPNWTESLSQISIYRANRGNNLTGTGPRHNCFDDQARLCKACVFLALQKK